MTRLAAIGAAPKKIGLLAGALICGMACLLSANDRLAYLDMHFGRFGKMHFGPAAKIDRAESLLTDQSGSAEILAARGLDQDPISPIALDVLGGSALLRGDLARADSVFRAAALFGWRDIPTQRYWLFASLAAGDYTSAAERLDALLRIQKTPAAMDLDALRKLEATAAGRAVLVEQMKAEPPWLTTYLLDGGSLEGNALANRIDTIVQARQQKVSFPYYAVSRMTWNLVHRGQVAAAARAWTVLQGVRPSSDDTFNGYGNAPSSPFQWHVVSSSDVSARVGHAPPPLSGEALHIAYDGAGSRSIATKFVALAPGAYAITWKAVGSGDARIEPSLRCGAAQSGIDVTELPSRGEPDRVWHFRIPPAIDCPYQSAGLQIRPSNGNSAAIDLWIGNLTIHAIAN